MPRSVAALTLMLLLAGCAAAEPPPPAPPPPPRPQAAAPRPTQPSRPAATLDPAVLAGMDAPQVAALLGPPQADQPRQLGRQWRWRKGGCTLTLALYPDVQDGTLRVASSDFAGTADPAACLAALRKDNVGGGDGR